MAFTSLKLVLKDWLKKRNIKNKGIFYKFISNEVPPAGEAGRKKVLPAKKR